MPSIIPTNSAAGKPIATKSPVNKGAVKAAHKRTLIFGAKKKQLRAAAAKIIGNIFVTMIEDKHPIALALTPDVIGAIGNRRVGDRAQKVLHTIVEAKANMPILQARVRRHRAKWLKIGFNRGEQYAARAAQILKDAKDKLKADRQKQTSILGDAIIKGAIQGSGEMQLLADYITRRIVGTADAKLIKSAIEATAIPTMFMPPAFWIWSEGNTELEVASKPVEDVADDMIENLINDLEYLLLLNPEDQAHEIEIHGMLAPETIPENLDGLPLKLQVLLRLLVGVTPKPAILQ